MVTLKEQLLKAIEETNDDPNTLVCFYQPVPEDVNYPGWHQNECDEPLQCTIDELPTDEFDAGYGGPNGSPSIAFSDKFIYIRVQYDGSEWFEAIPRHPEHVTKPIPWPGG